MSYENKFTEKIKHLFLIISLNVMLNIKKNDSKQILLYFVRKRKHTTESVTRLQ